MVKTMKKEAKPKVILEVGQKVMIIKPSKIHKAYMGKQGHVVSVRRSGGGFRAKIMMPMPPYSEKQREFAVSELRAL